MTIIHMMKLPIINSNLHHSLIKKIILNPSVIISSCRCYRASSNDYHNSVSSSWMNKRYIHHHDGGGSGEQQHGLDSDLNSGVSNSGPRNINTNLEKVNEMRNILDVHQSSLSSSNAGTTTITSKDGWDHLWKQNVTPWDLGKPTPVLISELKKERWQLMQRNNIISTREKNGDNEANNHHSSFYSLIPGCGGGYDLATVASSGFGDNAHGGDNNIVVGLDISPTSLFKASQTVQSILTNRIRKYNINDHSYNNDDHINDIPKTTNIHLMLGDFFDTESKWLNQSIIQYSPPSFVTTTTCTTTISSEITMNKMMKFDFIFDYTFFCAIPPNFRMQWGKRMSQLIRPNTGKLLTLIFPIQSLSSPGRNGIINDNNDQEKIISSPKSMPGERGPPYPVTIDDYKNALEPHGFQMMDGNPYEHEDTIQTRKGRELVCWWQLVVDDDRDIRNSTTLSRL